MQDISMMKYWWRLFVTLLVCLVIYNCLMSLINTEDSYRADYHDELNWGPGQAGLNYSDSSELKYIIGLSTINRPQGDLLLSTLSSMFIALENSTQSYIVIVQIGDEDQQLGAKRLRMVQNRFPDKLVNGTLEVVVIQYEWYQSLNILNHSNNNDDWERKLVADYTHLMNYAFDKKGEYYLHLEDDIHADIGFLNDVDRFVHDVHTDVWLDLSFSGLGLLGKLWKSSQLSDMINYFLDHNTGIPIDHLYADYVDRKFPPCTPENGKHVSMDCLQELGVIHMLHRPSLFTQAQDHLSQMSTKQSSYQSPGDTTRPDLDRSRVVWDTNRPIKHEPWPWEDVPIYVNPPAKISSTIQGFDETLIDLYTLKQVCLFCVLD